MSGSIVRGSEVLIRRVVQLNLAYVLGVGLYGLAIDEPYWREVGRAPGIYDGLFWLGLAVNGPSGFLADWLSSFARPFGSEVRFVLQCLLWSVLLWGQWRFYFLVANWSANRVKLVHALTFFAVVLALLGAVVAREAWLFGHRPSEFFVDQYFWFVRMVGLACSGLMLVGCRWLVSQRTAAR